MLGFKSHLQNLAEEPPFKNSIEGGEEIFIQIIMRRSLE